MREVEVAPGDKTLRKLTMRKSGEIERLLEDNMKPRKHFSGMV